MTAPTCDKTKRDRPAPGYGKAEDWSPADHDYVYVGDEYGSLADGGSYEIYVCRVCGRRSYSPMPD